MHCFLLFSRPPRPRPLQSITKAAKLGHTFCRHFSILNSVSNNATDFALALLDRQPLKIWFLFKLVLKLFSSQSGPRLPLQQNINITSPGHASGQHLWWQLGCLAWILFFWLGKQGKTLNIRYCDTRYRGRGLDKMISLIFILKNVYTEECRSYNCSNLSQCLFSVEQKVLRKCWFLSALLTWQELL